MAPADNRGERFPASNFLCNTVKVIFALFRLEGLLKETLEYITPDIVNILTISYVLTISVTLKVILGFYIFHFQTLYFVLYIQHVAFCKVA